MRSLSTAVVLLICICICMCRDSFHADAADIMTQGQQITDWESLVSPNGVFQLAFFSTRQSRNRYLGVRYNKGGRWVIWVANPENPIMDSSGILSLDNNGTLKLTYTGANPIVLNSSQNVTSSSNVTAKLLNSGNLVLLESDLNGTTKRVLWESFDSASDSLLPGMKIGVNFKTGQNWTILSWISDKVPALGGFVLGGDPNGSSQLYIWRRGEVYWRSGLWNGRGFDNIPQFTSDHNRFNFSYVSNADEKYFMYEVKDNSTDTMWVLDWWGQIAQFPEGSIVSCKGNSSSHNKGCVENKVPECRNKDVKFVLKTGSINPSFPLSYEEDPSLSISDCDEKCWNNCSCFAYSSMHDNGTGCMFGLHKLSFVEGNVGDVRVLPLDQGGSTKKKWWPWLVISVSVALLMLVLVFFCHRKARVFLLKEKKETNQEMLVRELGTNITPKKHNDENNLQEDRNQDQEFQFFSFAIIMAATDNFSATNKLGEGGFGPVYKGKLLEGQEIAVKRLSRSSGQGLEEFKNEVILIAKLQHMNLVRLLGCCFQGEERMLIYEYMPNKSLDSFLFDTIKSELLDWRTRFNIIEGIAQGLLYLHKYSRLRIIHRDLKASNILLDDQMNPKISDFGMARIFGRNESEAKTNRVVGTYGYMSPEYAMEGIFSVKSDVFSFGVLLLEIISGKKNTKFYHPDRQLNLIGYAWESWKDGIILELMDPTLGASCPEHEFLVCIHVGLLCVQESAEDRPTMSEVLSMLSNEVATLPPPKEPAFFTGGGAIDEKLYKGISESCSINDVTISELDAR